MFMTRRSAIFRAIGASTLIRNQVAFAKASQPQARPQFAVPPNACDCHTHIFGDPAKFPLSPSRTYTPEPASPQEMLAMHHVLGIRRVVIVTPSIYGTDNSATLFGMKAYGSGARGVAVIDEHTPDEDLKQMNNAGMQGIRINLATVGLSDPAVARKRFQANVERVKNLNWHIQMYASLSVISNIRELVENSPVPVVFDHFGGAQATLGVQQPGFSDLLSLLSSGKAYVKLSGAYRASQKAPDYTDATPLAKAIIQANANQVLWGTDWPHPDSSTRAGHSPTEMNPLLAIDDGILLNQLAVWAPDPAIRKKILVDNPARLYRF